VHDDICDGHGGVLVAVLRRRVAIEGASAASPDTRAPTPTRRCRRTAVYL
jgi:hypothetical protein